MNSFKKQVTVTRFALWTILIVLTLLYVERRAVLYRLLAPGLNPSMPELMIVPQRLPSTSASGASGATIAVFGYTFETPWDATPKTLKPSWARGLDNAQLIRFDSGQNITIQIWASSENDPLHYLAEQWKTHTGRFAFAYPQQQDYSRVDVLAVIMRAVPHRTSLVTTTRDIAREAILLDLKRRFVFKNASAIYQLSQGPFVGYEIVYRDEAGHGYDLELFENSGAHLSISIDGPATQADIDRILDTLHRR